MCVDVLISDLYVPQASDVIKFYYQQQTFSGVSSGLSNVHGQSAKQWLNDVFISKGINAPNNP